MATTMLRITGMHCPSCASLIQDVCAEFSGARSCVVDFAKGIGTIEHEDATLDVAALVQEIEGLGPYHVKKL